MMNKVKNFTTPAILILSLKINYKSVFLVILIYIGAIGCNIIFAIYVLKYSSVANADYT